jgi:hypothetical protein
MMIVIKNGILEATSRQQKKMLPIKRRINPAKSNQIEGWTNPL